MGHACLPQTLGKSKYECYLFWVPGCPEAEIPYMCYLSFLFREGSREHWGDNFFLYMFQRRKQEHPQENYHVRIEVLPRGALTLSLMVFLPSLLSPSLPPVAAVCCPARCHAGISRRKAPRHTPRQPRCCCISYQHSHRQEHKQPTTQKQGTLLKKLHVLPFRV